MIMKKTVLMIALLGISEKNASAFTYFIRKQAVLTLKLGPAENADVYITDFDTEAGISLWHEHCRVTGKPAIIMSSENPGKTNTVWVKKPVTASQLQMALADLLKLASSKAGSEIPVKQKSAPQQNTVSHLHVVKPSVAVENKKSKSGYQRVFSDEQSPNLTLSKDEIIECCGLRDDMHPAQQDFVKQAFFSAEKTLLATLKHAIKTAKEKRSVVYIQDLPVQFVVLPGAEKIVVELENRHLRHLCAMNMQVMPSLKILHVTPLECEGLFPAHHKNMHSAEQVLWQMALWTSRGRLPVGIDASAGLRLQYWPNFTRLQITPYAVHIAALLVRYSLSPLEVADTLKIPQRYVFSLIAAADAIGDVVQDGQTVNPVKMSWKQPNSLFSTILRSLKMA